MNVEGRSLILLLQGEICDRHCVAVKLAANDQLLDIAIDCIDDIIGYVRRNRSVVEVIIELLTFS